MHATIQKKIDKHQELAELYTEAGLFVETFRDFFVEGVAPQILFSSGFDYDLKVTVKHTGKHITADLIRTYQESDKIEFVIDSDIDNDRVTVKATKEFNRDEL